MAKEGKQPPLLTTTHTSLVVRLVLDEQGQIQRGELIDLHGKRVGRFLQLAELPTLIELWLCHTKVSDI